MDIVRKPAPAKGIKTIAVACSAAALAIGGLLFFNSFNLAAYTTSEDRLMLGTVVEGELTVTVRGNGTLVPSDVRWIAANVEGRVEQVFVKPGALVKKGEPLLELSNPLLEQQAEEIRWEVEAFGAETKALAVSLRNQLLAQKAEVIDAKMHFDSAKLKLDAEQTLLDAGKSSVSKIAYQEYQLAASQYEQRWAIAKARYALMQENNSAQLAAKNARLSKLEKTLARAQQQLRSLSVTASTTGVVQAVAAELGQRVSIGGNMAKLAKQDALYAELKIPERQIKAVSIGQKALIDTRLNQLNGTVIRIDPAVINGTVIVDIRLEDTLPQEARPDLSIDGVIEVSRIANTRYVARPRFAQSQSSASIFKLAADGKSASKIPVQFGIGSASQLQVLGGLNTGERIILSDQSAFEHLDTIAID